LIEYLSSNFVFGIFAFAKVTKLKTIDKFFFNTLRQNVNKINFNENNRLISLFLKLFFVILKCQTIA